MCPLCSYFVEERRDLGLGDAPQIWLAAGLSLVGVALLELPGVLGGDASFGAGDVFSVFQAVGFGTSFYLTERMMQREPDQVLSITAAQVAVTAAVAAVWAACDGLGLGPFDGGWLLDARRDACTLPGLFLDDGLRPVALAAAWTGLVTTALNRVAETTALGQLTSSEASVLLASEPLWAAFFGALFLGEALGLPDYVGGAFIVAACVAAATDAATVERALGMAAADDDVD